VFRTVKSEFCVSHLRFNLKHLQSQKFQISFFSAQIIARCSDLLCGMTRPTCVRAVILCVLISIGIDLVEVSERDNATVLLQLNSVIFVAFIGLKTPTIKSST